MRGASYYYAMSLWKGKRAQDPGLDLQQIESLLKKSITLDPTWRRPTCSWESLLRSEQVCGVDSGVSCGRGELNPDLADVHYRLGQAYVRTGEKDRAQEQFQVYQKIRAEHLAELDKQRAEIRQFVYSAKDAPGGESSEGCPTDFRNAMTTTFHRTQSRAAQASAHACRRRISADRRWTGAGQRVAGVERDGSARPRCKKRKVVVITFGGGARDQETFAPEGQENIPHLMSELIPQSTFFTQVVNRGILGHYVATASLATGVYETCQQLCLSLRSIPRCSNISART